MKKPKPASCWWYIPHSVLLGCSSLAYADEPEDKALPPEFFEFISEYEQVDEEEIDIMTLEAIDKTLLEAAYEQRDQKEEQQEESNEG